MVVNIEFLGTEPIENMITCMNFKVDKVIYFGYQEVIDKHIDSIKNFLDKYCGIQPVEFYSLPENNLQSILKTMREIIAHEQEQGNDIYFDITGGESLILVAFGMLSKEFETPIHMYDVEKNQLIELGEETKKSISSKVTERKIILTLDMFIEMRGGKINHELQKRAKNADDMNFIHDANNIWEIASKYRKYWNRFAGIVSAMTKDVYGLAISKNTAFVMEKIYPPNNDNNGNNNSSEDTNKKKKNTGITWRIFCRILDDLEQKGLLYDVVHTSERYRFTYKNEDVKACLCDGGSIWEIQTYYREKKHSDECRISVHIDWDGIIHSEENEDVLNEIDVFSLTGNVPTLISCKSGKMGGQQALHALYELETVTEQFGGRYAKKVLATANPLYGVYAKRARELGVEVRVL